MPRLQCRVAHIDQTAQLLRAVAAFVQRVR